jgi:hypothetical protein
MDYVVHCKRQEFDVYIGRGPNSRWGNPYSDKKGTLAQYQVGSVEEAISHYRRYLYQEIQSGRVSLKDLAELDGKVLGCWCRPGPCHGDVLVKAARWAKLKLDEDSDPA